MIAFCPLCKQSSGPYTEGEVTWIEADLTSIVDKRLME